MVMDTELVQTEIWKVYVGSVFRFFERTGVEIQMLARISASEGKFLANILRDVKGGRYRVLDRAQGAETELVHIIRPVEVIAVHQFPGLGRTKTADHCTGEIGDEAVDMPRSVCMMLGDEEILDLRAIGFPLVPDELGKLFLVYAQVEAVELRLVQRAREEVVPGIAQGILQDHGLGAAKRLIQLAVIVLLILLVPGV